MTARAGSAQRARKPQRRRPTKSGKRPAKGGKSSRGRRGSAKRPAWHVVALRALAVLAAVVALGLFSYWAYRITLTPIHDRGQATGNTHPGRTLRFYLDRPSVKEALVQVGG